MSGIKIQSDSRPNVLHVIPAMAPCYGGPSLAILGMCDALQRIGATTHIVATDAGGSGTRFDASLLDTDLRITLFSHDFSEQWKYSYELKRWLVANVSHYDVVHCHALWTHSTFVASRAAFDNGVPLVIRPAGMLSPYTFARGAWKKSLYWHLCDKASVRGASMIHATTGAEREDIIHRCGEVPIAVIANGISSQGFTAERSPNALREMCGEAANGRKIVMTLGRLHPKKGVTDFLIPAFSKLPDDNFLVIAGNDDYGAPNYRAEIKAAIDDFQLTSRVRLLGEIAPDRRWELYDGADVFVLPSHSENFGIVVAEAMARGCPVVVSDRVQARGHVADAGAGLVVPLRVSAVAEALRNVLADEAMRAAQAEAGRRYALKQFSWDSIATNILKMYRECARPPHRIG